MIKVFLNLLAVICLLWGAQAFADETNPIPSSANTDAANAFIQIQAQLHETQLTVESNSEQTVAAIQHNTDALSTDIGLLEQNIAGQSESTQKSQQTMLIVALGGMLALVALVIMGFLQLRTTTRLIEVAVSARPSALNGSNAMPVVESATVLPPSARAALEFSNARLLGVIERLEKRILELEHTAHPPLPESAENNVEPMSRETPAERRIADLVVEGQLFLDTNKPEKALSCFDAALEVQPGLADALIKKAAALEKLERPDDAIACYDRAIESEDAATTALLQKGGLLNRLARYEEALQCYERALRTQEKKAGQAA